MRALACLLSLFFSLGAAEEGGLHLSAYYYPWYGEERRHWREGYFGQDSEAGPALGEYSSRREETLQRHLQWSRDLGIDNWICSWWGPDSWEDETLRNWVLPALAAEGKTHFCLLYEAAGMLGLDPEKGIEFDAATSERFVSHFRRLCESYFSHPAYFRIEGRPVVFLYLSRAFTGEYARALMRARAVVEARGERLYLVGDEVYWGEPDPQRLALYDAVTAYNMHGPLPEEGREDWEGFLLACGEVYQRYREVAAGVGTRFIPGVIPGFDTRGHHYPIPRAIRPGADPDSFLEAYLRVAQEHLDPELSMLAVTSFNEWHEGTQLEPSRRGENGGGALPRLRQASSGKRP